MTSKLLGPGLVSPYLLADLVASVSVVYLINTLLVPVIKSYKQGKSFDHDIGSDKGHWFYGHLFKYRQSQEGGQKIIENVLPKFPAAFNYWLGPFFSLPLLYHPESTTPIFNSNAPKSEFVYNFVRPWIKDGLLTSSGEKWKRHRRLLTPAFHFTILKEYTKTFNQCIQVMLDKFEPLSSEPIDVENHATLMTLDVILQCAMSFKSDCQLKKPEDNKYLMAIKEISNIVVKRVENPLLQIEFLFRFSPLGRRFYKAIDYTHSTTKEVIETRRRLKEGQNTEGDGLKVGNKKLLDFIDILMESKDEDGVGLTDDEIHEEVETFLFAGHDTTSSAVTFLLYNLANNLEVQDRCRQEVEQVLGDKPYVEWSDLSRFEYLTMTIKESLRLHNVVPIIGRTLKDPLTMTSDFLQNQKVVLPRNLNVLLPIGLQTRNPQLWDNPEEFIPERFSKKEISKRPSHAFTPFSAGPRNCIGQNFALGEIKVAGAQVLRRFRLSIDESSPELEITPRVVLRSVNGVYVKFAPL